MVIFQILRNYYNRIEKSIAIQNKSLKLSINVEKCPVFLMAVVMDRMVIDSSVAIKWFIPQDYSLEANKILNSYQQGQVILLAPDLIYAEMGNIIWKMERFQGLENQDAQVVLDLFEQIKFNIVTSRQLLKTAYKFAASYQRSVYDSLYVVLSIREGCKFITADRKLYNAISEKVKNIQLLQDWS